MVTTTRRSAWLLITICLFVSGDSRVAAYTISGGTLIEDFTTLDNADLSNSTGLWNIVTRKAEAGRVADASGGTLRPISFGDGSDGTLDTSSGYTFDTDAKPNGYNFKSVNITGGTVTVVGSNPLIIRSLSTLTITPAISLNGTDGANGVANGSSTAPSGGTAITCPASGGDGGTASAGAVGNGGDGIIYTGATDVSGGAGNVDGANGADGGATAFWAGANFDTSTDFICGGGGGAGGGHRNTGTFQYATGGAGGAGGGTIRITAVGTLTVGNITADGGNGGDGAQSDGANCSGAGAGGHGGAIWLQTLADIPVGVPLPTVDLGTGGTSPCGGLGSDGNAGAIRLDSSAGNRPGHSTIADYDTDDVFPSRSYVVQSKTYDLNTLNAVFDTSPTITQATNGGSITISYAGSVDGSTFSDYTSSLTDLSGKNYRYLKFRINITTAGAAGASPEVSRIAIPFTDAGLEEIKIKLSPGCGTISNIGEGGNGATVLANALLFLLISYFGCLWIRTRHSSR